jgi:lycopene beta-cyclase
MTVRKFDIAIVGGGLAGGLIALALRRARPDLAVVLIEAGEDLGGNHRWSWFASDLSPAGAALLDGFRRSEWDSGYDVCFPGHSRYLSTPYRSLASADFDAGLRRELPPEAVRRAAVTTLSERGVTLASGEELAARAVIDCRGPIPAPQLKGGWQVFMGRHLHTDRPHGIERPIIMDAKVVQPDGYRFVYVLPLGAQEVFVEDTYYQDSPRLDRRALSSRIDAFCAERGWQGDLLTHETGVLPVITGGDFAAFQAAQRVSGVAVAGARGGFVHPLTSYTLPFAVDTALAIAADADLPGAQLAAMLEGRARAHWRATKFYRRLGSMLFGAAVPEQRYRVFERFYRLPENLIERFYAGRSTLSDQARILCGKPPVSIGGALAALAGRRPAAPLEHAA